jgi:transposase
LGRSDIDVAKKLGIVEGLLYTLVKKFKAANEPVAIDDTKSMQAAFNR